MQGSDDHTTKSDYIKKDADRPRRLCRICGIKIVLWHCAERGCPWCARCSKK